MQPTLCLALLSLISLSTLSSATEGRRVVAIGDLHGDIENAREALRLAQVTDDAGNWATGTDTVIQMGDLLDRGPHGHTIMELFERLRVQASAAGGELITLLGNHELMNYQGDAKFVVPAHFEALGGRAGWAKEFGDAAGHYGHLIVNRPTAVIRNGTVFVHAGIVHEVAALGTIEQLNDRMAQLLRDRSFKDPLLLNDGPVWTRRLIYSAMQGKCEETYTALQELNRVERVAHGEQARPIRRMVVGHTIQPNGAMRFFCNNTLIAIDIAISQYMQNGGHLGHLELKHPSFFGRTDGIEVPWFWYPPKPQTHHVFHLPSRPAFFADALGGARSNLAGHNGLDAADGASGGGATGGWSMAAAARWRPHKSTDKDRAGILALVAFAVVVWRVGRHCRKQQRGVGKKTDAV